MVEDSVVCRKARMVFWDLVASAQSTEDRNPKLQLLTMFPYGNRGTGMSEMQLS